MICMNLELWFHINLKMLLFFFLNWFFVLSIHTIYTKTIWLTINRKKRRIALSFGSHILGHTRVIGRVLQPGLADQQVSFAGHDHVIVRIDLHAVSHPVHSGRRNAVRWQASELHVPVRFHAHRVRYGRERFLQVWKKRKIKSL